MMPATRRLSLALTSLHALVHELDTLPHSKDLARVLAGASECKQVLERWHEYPPAKEEHERVMSRVHRLHVAASWLRRGLRPSAR
jgi:hypothetical protein